MNNIIIYAKKDWYIPKTILLYSRTKRNLKINKNDIKIEKNILGNKRNNNTVNNEISNNHELNYIIEDFIYNKKILLVEEYKKYFEKMKKMI